MDGRTLVIRQGEVYWLHFGASEGSAPAGRRPALVVQHDRFNRSTAHVLHLKNEDFSRDPKVVAAMNADPLIAHETQPTQTVAELVRADERLRDEFSRITLPVLILHGTSDQAAKASGSQAFFDAAGSKDKTLKLYDGHFHDLLNDVDKETVVEDIKSWLGVRLPATRMA